MIGLEKISPSALDCFEGCPRLFYYQNWLGLKLEDDKRHMDFGTAIHGALETLYSLYDDNFKNRWDGEEFQPVEDKFLSLWRHYHVTEDSFQKFLNTKAGRESGFTNKQQLYEQMKEDGLIMLKSYWKEKEHMLVEYGHDLKDFEVVMKVEMINPVEPHDKLPIPLSMRLDAISRDLSLVVDFKTSSGAYNQEETRKKIQGQCYIFARFMTTGVFRGKFDYIVLRKGMKSDDRIQVVQLQYDEADMVAFYQRVRSILVKIANREFDRPSMGHPRWCRCWDYEQALSVK